MILVAVRNLLLADATIAAALSSRVYVRQAPQGVAQPFAVLNRISRVGVDSLDGPSGLARHRVQLDLYAETEAALQALAERSRVVLNAVKHVDAAIDAASPPATLRVQALTLQNEFDQPEEPGQPRLFRRTQDWLAVWNED